jgi:RNA polymerase sigma factor (TIGR02999 family)
LPSSTTPNRPTSPSLTPLREGSRSAAAALFGQVYGELHSLARRYMGQERADHTLQPTALLHEAFLKLLHRRDVSWKNREQFLGMAAQAMRFVLVDHARARSAKKRGEVRTKVLLDEALELYEARAIDLISLDEALDALSDVDPQLAHIVELRFFAGMTVEEVARALSVSKRTIERGWWTARAFLRREMGLLPRSPD